MTVQRVRESDVDAVVAMVHELAAYARASEQCQLTATQLRAAQCPPNLTDRQIERLRQFAGVRTAARVLPERLVLIAQPCVRT
ncbi:MAG: hypothetical protein LC808_44845, partial [Actinobacteria bacterium]|nr:hypothetical protein [Actinomycetota bacterium]